MGRDFDFSIEDVIALMGLKTSRKKKSSIDACCPFCDDTRYHLNINLDSNVWRCNRCGEYGGMIDLYGRMHGLNNKEAYKSIKEGLKIDSTNVTPKKVIKRESTEIEIEVRGDLDVHAVYSAMLQFPEFKLKKEHCENLKNRGFSDCLIEAFGYKSMPEKKKENEEGIPKKLEDMGFDLLGIPGFYKENGKTKMVIDHKGFIIPVRNANGKIVQAQIRKDSGDPKYVYLSSRYKDNGTRTLIRVHVAGDLRKSKKVYITEGPLKADIASTLLGVPFIALQGVNCQAHLPTALSALKNIGVETIVEAFDMDKFTNPFVKKAVLKVTEMIKSYGIEVSHAKWDPKFKGIDDLLHFSMIENNCSA